MSSETSFPGTGVAVGFQLGGGAAGLHQGTVEPLVLPMEVVQLLGVERPLPVPVGGGLDVGQLKGVLPGCRSPPPRGVARSREPSPAPRARFRTTGGSCAFFPGLVTEWPIFSIGYSLLCRPTGPLFFVVQAVPLGLHHVPPVLDGLLQRPLGTPEHPVSLGALGHLARLDLGLQPLQEGSLGGPLPGCGRSRRRTGAALRGRSSPTPPSRSPSRS